MTKISIRYAIFAALVASLAGFPFFASAQTKPLKPWTGGSTPLLELTDLDGKVHKLSDYRGKAVLINFWATWCAPCREEMPSIERLRGLMQGKPFVILAVNVGESGEAARAFAEKLPVTFTILLDRDTRTTRAWSARVLPATYILGPDGNIRYSHLGELDWSSKEVTTKIQALLPSKLQSSKAPKN